MSQYMELRFRGIVKEEFREIFEPIAKEGKWKESADSVFTEFGEYDRISTRFRFKNLDSYVERWNKHPWDAFYDKETGLWFFHTQMNMRNDWLDIMDDFEDIIVPYCIEKVLWWEEWYEDFDDIENFFTSTVYEYFNGRKHGVGTIKEDGSFVAFSNERRTN